MKAGAKAPVGARPDDTATTPLGKTSRTKNLRIEYILAGVRCMFKKGSGNWTQYRRLPKSIEVDFHYSESGPRNIPYWEAMDTVWGKAFDALEQAYHQGVRYVIFTHGSSTSRPGRTTARSQIRKLMRSPAATPYIRRSECIQHETVFVTAIR